ncbi:hypothetical protein BDV18DRAFT_165203 [Aspergillus unguis]
MSDTRSEAGSKASTTLTNDPLYSYSQCITALEGTGVPDDLTSATAQCAVIRGLHCLYGFTTSPQIIDLCARSPQHPEILRARNARLIMSNVILEGLENPESQPYYIWSPDFAEEDTYHQVAQQYPAMCYQVSRACAAAGYFSLYKELDLLPDISIAEKAREGLTQGRDEIYRLIMSSSVKYAVMDDFDRSITLVNPRAPAFLNSDTHVRWKLQWREPINKDAAEDFAEEEVDIKEDRYMGLDSNEPEITRYDRFTPQEVTLLWEPLPLDLPTMKKDLLRQMAAYEGNVEDRYVRLRNPRSQADVDSLEVLCVVRGVYHNTMFARWWQHQLDTNAIPVSGAADRVASDRYVIQQAINARRIIINNIGTFTEDTPCKPWIIWWPLKPDERTLTQLARRCPLMHLQIAITAIFYDYEDAYRLVNFEPNAGLLKVAEQVGNPIYKQDLQKRAEELGIGNLSAHHGYMIRPGDEGYNDGWDHSYATIATDMEPARDSVPTRL